MEANDTSDGHYLIGMHNASTKYDLGVANRLYDLCTVHFGVEASDFSAED
jgi:hypothetical protein